MSQAGGEIGSISEIPAKVLPSFDPTKKAFAYRGSGEKELVFVATLLKPGMCFFDIGAYHRIYGIVAARAMRRQGG